LTKTSPENPAGYYRLGLLYRMQKDYGTAMTNFEKAISINPRLMDVFTNIVLLYAGDKKFDKALRMCDQQLKRVSESPASMAIIYNIKGGIYLSQGKKADAEKAFKKGLEKNPNLMRAYYALARIYLMDKKEDKAIEQYKVILEKNPMQAGPHMLLGTIYDMQKKFDLSEKHYRKALEINPRFAPAANNLAYLLAEHKNELNVALGFAREARKLLPNDPGVMDTLGWIYYKKELYDGAILELEDSAKKLPENATVRYHLGMAYYKKGDKDRAREELKKALELNKNFEGADEAKKVLSEL